MLTNMMGAMGRKGDSMIAHLTPGDVIIPRDIVLENPEFLTKFKKAMQDNQSDYRTHIAGSGYENYNPETGAPEFGFGSFFKSILKSPLKVLSTGLNPLAAFKSGGIGALLDPSGTLSNLMSPDKPKAAPAPAPAPAPVAPPPALVPAPNIGPVDEAFKAKRPDEGVKPYDLFSRDVGGQSFGSLDPMQQRSYLATQGTSGSGLGDEDKNYYMNLLQRNLIDEGGQMGNINQALLPIERNYLSRLGLPTDDTQGFFQALQK